jgi:ubiquitin carboxyl-terminal hydrolase 4/11/15
VQFEVHNACPLSNFFPQPREERINAAAAETNGAHNQHPPPRNDHDTTAAMPPPPPTPKRQRQDVVRLLYANHTSPPLQGEAFFLLDWNWWTRWCHYVGLFEDSCESTSQQQQQQQRNEAILRLLPPGAVVPTRPATTDTDNDDDSSSTSSSDSENQVRHDDDDGPPGEIDNSSLLVRVVSSKKQSTSSLPRLKPNLVRGHHYELIPREVYNALRIWYGEVSPTICRRVELHQKVAKIALYTDFTREQQRQVLGNVGQRCAACQAPFATCRCAQCNAVHYCGKTCQESSWPYHRNVCKRLAATAGDFDNDELAVLNFHTTQGRVGLNNLGNTCFMNSALQCLSHATPLTRHFLSNNFKADVNTSNPLGTGGHLANAYESVLKDIWLKTGQPSTTPSELKRAIAQFAPRFAGCSQHDAQEFLAYLLDGLHEDLNRIREPPYVEKPEVGLEDLRVAGAKAWDAHQRRNDSLVMDTFYGQFKSTCVCPKCERVSVSFDAFNHVALEIPQLQDLPRVIPVILFRAVGKNGSSAPSLPSRFGVTVKRGSFTVDLRQGLSELCDIPPERLHICDVYDHSIFEILKDNKPVATIRNDDILAAYEATPYDDCTIHTVASQVLVRETNGDGQEMDVAAEMAASADLNVDGPSMEPFGWPFLTAFDAHSTCQQVWDHVWKLVTDVVAPDFFASGCDEDSLKSLLRIRIVDNAGKPRPVFLDAMDVSNVLGVDEELDRASLVPPASDKELMEYLGKDCADRFLFIRLEWMDKSSTVGALEKEEEKVGESSTVIDVGSFLRYENHATLLEATQKLREAQSSRGVTLDKCFETFTKPERLDEHNMWYCSKCKEHVRAMKTMELWRLPNILVVTLKRFEFKHMLRRDKLDTFVSFPLDGLDMSKHCASMRSDDKAFVEDNVPAVYDLFAVTNHYGRMGFGHYTAFARRWDEHGMSNDWALFDDSSVQSVGDGRGLAGRNGVVSSAAYVLFYRRRDFI